jgi:hypothetical protein
MEAAVAILDSRGYVGFTAEIAFYNFQIPMLGAGAIQKYGSGPVEKPHPVPLR